MSVTINGTTGISKVQDGVIQNADLADNAVTSAKLDTNIAISGNLDVGTIRSANGTSAVTIDANGYVFRNNLPAFNVYNSATGSAFTANTTATWDVEILDNNNDFDLVNNRFVAPVDGVYYLGARMLSNDDASVHFQLQINGGTASGSRGENSSINNYRQVSVYGVFNLSSGDYVTVYVQNNPAYGTDYSNFCGYLIG